MRVVSVLVDAAEDVDSEAEAVVLEERLEELLVVLLSPSSQSVGKSTEPFVLFTATSPVAPVAWIRASAVFSVVHKTFLIGD